MTHIASIVAAAVDGIPYYIHYLIDELKFVDRPLDGESVERTVTRLLTDPQDGWHMMHYRERIETYYAKPQQRSLVLTLLDVLSTEDSLPFEPLFNRAKVHLQLIDEDAERVRDTLTLLQRDHYVVMDENGAYRFRFPLVRRWWTLQRG